MASVRKIRQPTWVVRPTWAHSGLLTGVKLSLLPLTQGSSPSFHIAGSLEVMQRWKWHSVQRWFFLWTCKSMLVA